MFYGRLFAKSQSVRESWDGSADMSHQCDDKVQNSSVDAELVISATSKDYANCDHYPLIDLDIPVNIVPSSRVGQTHLYINHPVTQEGLFEILDVLAKHGIVEPGYARAAKSRGYSAVRLPWVKKKESIK